MHRNVGRQMMLSLSLSVCMYDHIYVHEYGSEKFALCAYVYIYVCMIIYMSICMYTDMGRHMMLCVCMYGHIYVHKYESANGPVCFYICNYVCS